MRLLEAGILIPLSAIRVFPVPFLRSKSILPLKCQTPNMRRISDNKGIGVLSQSTMKAGIVGVCPRQFGGIQGGGHSSAGKSIVAIGGPLSKKMIEPNRR